MTTTKQTVRAEAILRHYGTAVNPIEDADVSPGLALWHLLADLLHFCRENPSFDLGRELLEAQEQFEEEVEVGQRRAMAATTTGCGAIVAPNRSLADRVDEIERTIGVFVDRFISLETAVETMNSEVTS